MLTQASVVGVLAIGMTFVIATAGIDLSVGSIVAAAGVFGGILVGDDGTSSLVFIARRDRVRHAPRHASTRPPSPTGGSCPFIATLAMFSIARGLALLLNDKLPVSLLDLNGGSFGDPRPFSLLWFGTGRILGIPVSVYVFLAITVLGWIAPQPHALRPLRRRGRRQPRGRAHRRRPGPADHLQRLRPVRASSPASRPCCSARGSGAPRPVSGNLYELDAIGAVVIGGTSLAGGRATIVGTFLGVLTFALIFSLMTQLNLSTEIQQVTKGLIVLGAVLLQRPEARY